MLAQGGDMSKYTSGLLNRLSYDIGEQSFFRFIIQELDDFRIPLIGSKISHQRPRNGAIITLQRPCKNFCIMFMLMDPYQQV